jgi:anti-sigma factor RsiW
MSEHFNDRQLIDTLFELNAADDRARVESHLAGCPACRRRADALRARFDQLSLLREDVAASETIIAGTVRAARLRRFKPREDRKESPWASPTPGLPRAAMFCESRAEWQAPQRTPPRRWRPVAAFALVLLVLAVVPLALREEKPAQRARQDAPASAPATPEAEVAAMDMDADEAGMIGVSEPMQVAALAKDEAPRFREEKESMNAADIEDLATGRAAGDKVAAPAEAGALALADAKGGELAFAARETPRPVSLHGLAAGSRKAASSMLPRAVPFDLPKADGSWTADAVRIDVLNREGRTAIAATNPSADWIAVLLIYHAGTNATLSKTVVMPPVSATNLTFDLQEGGWR